MKQISILGCGWLGLPLAKSLIKKGYSVKGSTTSAEKISVLEENGIDAYQIEIRESEIIGDISSFLLNSEILIIDIPPKLRKDSGENFVKKIKKLITQIKKAKIAKVIFISSTSVYNDDYSIVTETTQTKPDTESGKQLVEAEKLFFINMFDFSTTIIRFGGLIGDDRHPVYHLAGKQNLANPHAAVNLIHQLDCIGIIEAILRNAQTRGDAEQSEANDNWDWNQTFNAVTPFHPTRKDYYTQKAAEFGLSLPEFSENPSSFGKIIHANRVESELNYEFQKPNL